MIAVGRAAEPPELPSRRRLSLVPQMVFFQVSTVLVVACANVIPRRNWIVPILWVVPWLAWITSVAGIVPRHTRIIVGCHHISSTFINSTHLRRRHFGPTVTYRYGRIHALTSTFP